MRECPRCGYQNVSRAVYCFRCGRALTDERIVDGVDGTARLIEGALRFIRERGHSGLDPSRVERLRETRSKVRPENLNGEPLTCLRCGALNLPRAQTCTNCSAALMVPDLDFNLEAHANARTSVGQVRKNNEDNLSLWALDGVLLALVADGMGGAAAGEEASRLAVEAVQAEFLGDDRSSDLAFLSEDDLSSRVREAIQDANKAVVERAQGDVALKGMGTTSTLALVRGNQVIVAHVGDSRAYLLDGQTKRMAQVTTDHSFVQALVESKLITPEQARTHPMNNVLYRALGQSMDLEVDLFKHFVKAGDRLIMCSDGLTKHLNPDEIKRIVLESGSPEEATLDLVELTNERGGEDNVSVIVVQFENAVEHDPDATVLDP